MTDAARRANAQEHPSDELGWLLDGYLRRVNGGGFEPCPKAVKRAHAALMYERDDYKHALAHIEQLKAERAALADENSRLAAELAATNAALDRWQTGTQIEGDYVRASGNSTARDAGSTDD